MSNLILAWIQFTWTLPRHQKIMTYHLSAGPLFHQKKNLLPTRLAIRFTETLPRRQKFVTSCLPPRPILHQMTI